MNRVRKHWRYGLWAFGGVALLISVSVYVAWHSPEGAVPSGPPDSPTAVGDETTLETDAAAEPVAAEEPAQVDLGALWTAIDEASVTEVPAYKEVVQDRALVRIADVSGGWRVGQRIAVPIPQLNEIFTPVIERVQPGPSGTRAYIGTLTMAEGRAHRFTITVGPGNTFAHLSTPLGTYELVATGELGWLMPTANMDRHVDHSLPDFAYPGEPPSLEP